MNEKIERKIGVVGGMGPEASARLYLDMIEMAREEFEAKGNDEYPRILLDSLPVPDFISETSKVNEALEMLIESVEGMSQLELVCIGIACNTAHILLERLESVTEVPFVSIIEEARKGVEELGVNKVGLLASPTTVKTELYQNEFNGNGIEVLILDEEIQEELGEIIKLIVGGQIEGVRERLGQMGEALSMMGAEAIILGCTELPLVFPEDFELPVISSLEVLARALLKRYYEGEDI